jgi:hypothetical protein
MQNSFNSATKWHYILELILHAHLYSKCVAKLHFLTLFRVFFYLQATTGGYVNLKNRDDGNKSEYHPLVGKTTEREFEYHWDLEKPFHNLVSGVDDPPFLSVPDLTENVRIISLLVCCT